MFSAGRLSIASLSCKAGFGHDTKATPPHRSQAELPVAACSSRGMEVLSVEVQTIGSFLDHTPLASLASPGRPAFEAVKPAPHHLQHRELKPKNKAMPAPWMIWAAPVWWCTKLGAGRCSAGTLGTAQMHTVLRRCISWRGSCMGTAATHPEPLYWFWKHAVCATIGVWSMPWES